MKKIFFVLFVSITISMFAQDPPSAKTTYYGIRMWSQDSNPSADSINQNWKDIDSVLYDLIVFLDPRYFDSQNDTITLRTFSMGTLGFALGENLYLPYHDPPYSDLGGGAIGFTTSGYVVYNNSGNSRFDSLATLYDLRNSLPDLGGVVNLSSAQNITGEKTFKGGLKFSGKDGFLRLPGNVGFNSNDVAQIYYNSSDTTIYVYTGTAYEELKLAERILIGDVKFFPDVSLGSISNSETHYLGFNSASDDTQFQVFQRNWYTTGELAGAGGSPIHWDNLTNTPNDVNASIYYVDSSVVISLTQDTEAMITNATDNLFTLDGAVSNNITISGDTLTISSTGIYEINASFSFSGGAAGVYEFYTKTNATANSNYKIEEATSGTDSENASFNAVLSLTATDVITFWVVNTGSNTDFTAIHSNITIEKVR